MGNPTSITSSGGEIQCQVGPNPASKGATPTSVLTDSVQPRTIAAQIQRQVGIPTSQVRSGAKSNVKWGGESDVKSAIAHTPSPAPLLFLPFSLHPPLFNGTPLAASRLHVRICTDSYPQSASPIVKYTVCTEHSVQLVIAHVHTATHTGTGPSTGAHGGPSDMPQCAHGEPDGSLVACSMMMVQGGELRRLSTAPVPRAGEHARSVASPERSP